MPTPEISASRAWREFAPRALIALTTLAAVGASIGLAIGFFALIDPIEFLTHNTGSIPERRIALASLGIGAFLALLPAGGALLVKRVAAIPMLCLVADWLAPLSLVAFIPVLLTTAVWNEGQSKLTFLVLLGGLVLVAEPLFERSFRSALANIGDADTSRSERRVWLRRHVPTALVVIAAVGYAAHFSYYTLLHHRQFGTAGFDLGINVNWCFNALHGHPFRTTVLFGPGGGSMLAGHAIYAVFLWVPLFALKPGAEVLLIYQSVMVGLAALPLYWFARTQIPRAAAAVVALSYLLYAPLHGPNFYDFHELLVVLPWHFLLYWLIATNRLRWAALVVAVIWAHREDLAIGTAVLGLFLVVSGARPRFGAVLAASSLVWFVVDKFVIMARAGSWWFASIYKDLVPAGQAGYGAVVHTILINPAYFLSTLLSQDKLVYFLHLFVPLAFLPLRRRALALLAVPGFFFTLMTTGYAPTISIAFQYTTHWVPYLFASAVLGLRLIGQDDGAAKQRGALCALLTGGLVHSLVFGALLHHGSFVGGFTAVNFVETDHDKALYAGFRRLADKIPPDASVAASEYELPHVAARLDAYTLKDAHGDADYLLVRRHGGNQQSVLQQAFDRNSYGLVGQYEDTLFLFKQGHKSPETRRAITLIGVRPPPEKRDGA